MKALVLAELWYPQGGGAELVTHLYVNRLVESGAQVSLATNSDVSAQQLPEGVRMIRLPITENETKPLLLVKKDSLVKKLAKVAANNDVLYVTGKLLFLVPAIRKFNPSLRVISHLHDYQIICPQASLYNFNLRKLCEDAWNPWSCSSCCMRLEFMNSRGATRGTFSLLTGFAWKQVISFDSIVDSVDTFVAVSKAQRDLIVSRIIDPEAFRSKCSVVYNPVDKRFQYVKPNFTGVTLGFMSGGAYHKGIHNVVRMVNSLRDDSIRLIAAKMPISISSGRFEFLKKLSGDELRELFKKVWISLFMSLSEDALPSVTTEAQLMGRPVVASNVGGAIETLAEPGTTGDVMRRDHSDFEEMINKYIQRLSGDPDGYTRRISEIAAEFFERRSYTSYEQFLRLLY